MNKPSEEEMDYIMKMLEGGLGNLFGDFAKVKAVKVPKGGIEGKVIETYMKYPIIRLDITREGVGTNVSMCCMEDIIECLPHAIGTLLGLVPEKYRNNILAEAIQEDMKPNGLFDDDDEDDEEDDED